MIWREESPAIKVGAAILGLVLLVWLGRWGVRLWTGKY